MYILSCIVTEGTVNTRFTILASQGSKSIANYVHFKDWYQCFWCNDSVGYGLVEGRDTRKAVYLLRSITESSLEANKDLHLHFIWGLIE